jgi:hypothetical protein
MRKNENPGFDWDELVQRIQLKKVIPVIGQGLYWVEKDGKERLLYDYLAERMARETGIEPPARGNHRFAKAAFQFLKKKSPLQLRKFLSGMLGEVEPVTANPLWQLARVKPFNIFIDTAYDDFLAAALKAVRKRPTRVLQYTLQDKKLNKLDNRLFDELEESKATLVYHIYGSLERSIDPAFTEKDILETIVQFQEDMGAYPGNNLFQELKSSSLLFIGCGYDDWLFRFFTRTVANAPFQITPERHKYLFFADDRFHDKNNKKPPVEPLPRFLKNYQSEVFFSGGGTDFAEALFEKLEKELPEEIIPVTDFPAFAFISFHGANRAAAARLAANLRQDGIDVWLDEKKFEPGDKVDETIAKAIDTCPVFIPLISEESQQLQAENGTLKYHCREWEWAYGKKQAGHNPKTIMPVKIDGKGRIYDKFAGYFYVTVKDGRRTGGYDELKTRLLKMRHARGG